MAKRGLLALTCVAAFILAAYISNRGAAVASRNAAWEEVAPGILRTREMPYGYALVKDGHALVIDAPVPWTELKAHGVKTVDAVLLTHHHRDTVAAAGSFLEVKIPVRAPLLAKELLSVEGVAKYWKESIPLRGSRTSYFVTPVGFEGIDCTLQDGQKIDWRGYSIEIVGTPGHSRDHLSFAVTAGKDSAPILFAGDAIASEGKIWTPFTTDWDHWTDAGLKPTYESLRKLAALKPVSIYPSHGQPIRGNPRQALEATAKAVEEVAFLKSFQRFSDRIGDSPKYPFLVEKAQLASAGDKPWSRVSPSLWITGNTYVLISREAKAFLVMDPWGQRSLDQINKLREDLNLGDLEIVMFSHAHFDHYDGVHLLPNREKFKVWTLDRVAEPIAEPSKLRAPFIDMRPVTIDRRFRDGDTAKWREYTFRFHFFPGQTEFTMAVETAIDGKKCLFTADNFFHREQFSGSGGWMGLNRSFPLPYAASAKKVLDITPDWVLAEHGGPYEFNAEDFKRRVQWGEAAARAADRIAPSGNHRRDWNPHRISVEPVVVKAGSGQKISVKLKIENVLDRNDKAAVTVQGRNVAEDQTVNVEAEAGKTTEKNLIIQLHRQIVPGRHILLLRNMDSLGVEGVDAFLAVDVE